MGLIEDELSELKKLCERRIAGSKLVTCVQAMVRVEIKRTECKNITVCIQFPKDYPKSILLIELKSKSLSEKLLQRLTEACEGECRKFVGKPQILPTLILARKLIDENPLFCCFDEIGNIRKSLTDAQDEIKLRQKSSSILLEVHNGNYFLKSKVAVPDDYPQQSISLAEVETNFPPALKLHIVAQSKEIARRCVEAPLKSKKNDPPFEKRPSLEKAVMVLVNSLKNLPGEKCQYCKMPCLPPNPQEAEMQENSPRHAERLFCGHLLHQECFFKLMKKPPFGNKRCESCGQRIFHHKWSFTDKLAEDRWAHEQARERELAEVEDFFK